MHVIAKKVNCCSFQSITSFTLVLHVSSCQTQRNCLGGVLVNLEAYFVVAYLFFYLGVDNLWDDPCALRLFYRWTNKVIICF